MVKRFFLVLYACMSLGAATGTTHLLPLNEALMEVVTLKRAISQRDAVVTPPMEQSARSTVNTLMIFNGEFSFLITRCINLALESKDLPHEERLQTVEEINSILSRLIGS